MSVYTYKCIDCENVFDIKANLEEKESGEGEKFACPKCGSKKISGHFSASNFIKNLFTKDEGCGCSSGSGSCCGGDDKNEEDKGDCCRQ